MDHEMVPKIDTFVDFLIIQSMFFRIKFFKLI